MPPKSIGEQNYEIFADRYATRATTKPHNAYYDRPAVFSLLPEVAGLRVLDVGCGPGEYTTRLVEQGAHVTAFDVTPRMVAITKARIGDRADVLRANLENALPFASATFDLVLCPLVLDNIEDWGAVFKEFHRVLKPGGTLVFSSGHPQGDYEWLHYRVKREINYFEVEYHEIEWGGFGDPKPLIRFYRRPLAEQINPLLAAGLTLDHVLEPRPTEEFKKADPERYERLMHAPGFICMRATKGTA
jgi:SAM-dependent methyltransferase